MDSKTTMKVIVHKANLPLKTNESVSSFTNSLHEAARHHMALKSNTTYEKLDAWLVETYSDKLVMSVYQDSGPNKYYAYTYKRETTGAFTFGEPAEMERVTVYKPKEQLVAKSVFGEFDWPQHGWAEMEKNFWAGVL